MRKCRSSIIRIVKQKNFYIQRFETDNKCHKYKVLFNVENIYNDYKLEKNYKLFNEKRNEYFYVYFIYVNALCIKRTNKSKQYNCDFD